VHFFTDSSFLETRPDHLNLSQSPEHCHFTVSTRYSLSPSLHHHPSTPCIRNKETDTHRDTKTDRQTDRHRFSFTYTRLPWCEVVSSVDGERRHGSSSAYVNDNVSTVWRTYIFERHFDSNSFSLDTKSPERRMYQQILMFTVGRHLLAQLKTFLLQWCTKLLLCLQTRLTTCSELKWSRRRC